MQINGVGIDIFAGSIDNGEFAACTIARINAKYPASTQRGLQQQVTQIRRKYVDSVFFCLAGEFYTHFAFHGWSEQALISIFHRFRKLFCERRGGFGGIVLRDIWLCLLIEQRDAYTQHLLTLSTVKRQHAMGNKFSDTFVEIVVELIDAIGILLSDFFRVRTFSCDSGAFEE